MILRPSSALRSASCLAGLGALLALCLQEGALAATDRCRGSDPVAATICASPEYRAMDREIAALRDRAAAQFAAADRRRLGDSQARYLKQRKGCGWAAHNSAHPGAAVDECVRASLEGRVRALRHLVDRGGF